VSAFSDDLVVTPWGAFTSHKAFLQSLPLASLAHFQPTVEYKYQALDLIVP
jgi:hypothetical protein